MNKQTMIDSYYNRKKNISCVTRFCREYPFYSSKTALIPECILSKKKKKSKISKKTKAESLLESSVSQTVSFLTQLTRVKTDSVFYKEIICNRKEHKIFYELEKDDVKEKKWYFIEDHTKKFCGPYNCLEMDKFFEIHKINPRTKIKRKVEDDDYFFLSVFVKRYYKNILGEKFNFEKKNLSLSNKFSNFRKGGFLIKKIKFRENYEHSLREERTLSLVTRPNLIYLENMLPEQSDEDEDEEFCYSRMRAQTLVN